MGHNIYNFGRPFNITTNFVRLNPYPKVETNIFLKKHINLHFLNQNDIPLEWMIMKLKIPFILTLQKLSINFGWRGLVVLEEKMLSDDAWQTTMEVTNLSDSSDLKIYTHFLNIDLLPSLTWIFNVMVSSWYKHSCTYVILKLSHIPLFKVGPYYCPWILKFFCLNNWIAHIRA